MALPRRAVLGIMVDNLAKRKSVLPLPKRVTTRWARGLDIPEGGECVIYTGHIYQLAATISAMAGLMAMLEGTWITKMMGVGRAVNKIVDISMFMARRNKAEQAAFDRSLRSIALLLRHAGVEFGYLYGKELYSGALVYDEGVDKVFVRHAERVKKLLASHGVKRVITVDPHTTNMLRHVYPEVLDGFDVEVKSYLEVLAELSPEPARELGDRVVIHDSCVYARSEDVVDQPRELLQKAGVTVESPELSGVLTHCCGGPIESLFPARAHAVACNRAEQLEQAGCRIATMCPICMINLRSAANGDGERYTDISDLMAEAYLDQNEGEE